MRQHYRQIAIGTAFLLATCGNLDTFTIEESARTTVPGATVLGQLIGGFGFDGFSNFDLKSTSEFENQGVEASDIDSVRLQSLTLRIVSPAGSDLSFMSSLEFFAEAPGLARKRIAHKTNFPAGAASVELEVDDVELKPYAVAQSMSITTAVTGEQPSQETEIEAVIKFDVDVDVSGLACGR